MLKTPDSGARFLFLAQIPKSMRRQYYLCEKNHGAWLKSLIGICLLSPFFSMNASGQVNESQTGAWYMYFWEMKAGERPFGVQGDFQYRNWNLMGDLEQLLLRGGIYYQEAGSKWRLTAGYANIRSGVFGESSSIRVEHRIYQEALFLHKWLERIQFMHRFRLEQRFFDEGIIRTRGRYNLFANIAINKKRFEKGCIYLSLYNELFINGERIVADRVIGYFDRNRSYAALGYQLSGKLKFQLGYMQQITSDWSKGQLQLSFHQKL